MKVVIVGGSFGGLTTAYELRKRLPSDRCAITLISRDRRFVFIPSLPWVAMGSKTLDQISFDLEEPLRRKEIEFVHAAVTEIDAGAQKVTTGGNDFEYDYLVIATGHRSANEAVPGLGPFDGPGHSLMSPPEAEEAKLALESFIQRPGPMVIGCAPGASCIGPAYEFAFEVDHLLRKKKIRHQVPIVFVTPEPFLGHLGIGGVGKVRQFLEGALEERDIHYYTSVACSKIGDSSVELTDGRSFDSQFSLVIPPLAGVKAVAESTDLSNPKGFVPVDEYYRHQKFQNVYSVGVAVAFPPVDETEVPVNFPKTGHMTEQMAAIVAENIVAATGGGEFTTRPLVSECILDMGDTAARIRAEPARPPRNVAKLSEGRQWLWAKKIFERYCLWQLRNGRSVARGLGW